MFGVGVVLADLLDADEPEELAVESDVLLVLSVEFVVAAVLDAVLSEDELSEVESSE